MRDAKLRGTIADKPHCVEAGINPKDPTAKIGFLLGIGDGEKQVFCVTGPGFRGQLPEVGAFVELTGQQHTGTYFSFAQISILSMPQTLEAIHDWDLRHRR